MSKSLGNLVFVGDLLKEWEPMAIRLALLEHHYRTDWDGGGDSGLARGTERLERWRRAGEGAGGIDEVRRRLDDDLDAPGALEVLDEVAATGTGMSQGAALLGVTL
jgi:L-cysteine:1D-myo-inositol 2-amino-2-deoxy-alpha-D-glucopyranoside ligase